MICSDVWWEQNGPDILKPYNSTLVAKGNISYGQSSYGYDLILGNKLSMLNYIDGTQIIDPKHFDKKIVMEVEVPDGERFVIPPHAFVMGTTREYITIPRNAMGLCIGKSTYARCGLTMNVTAVESGWQGHLTIEMRNTTQMPVAIYPGEGVVQLLMLLGDQECRISYADRKGKYQNQPSEPVLPRIKK